MAISLNSVRELRKPLKSCAKIYFSTRILDPYGTDGRFPLIQLLYYCFYFLKLRKEKQIKPVISCKKVK